MNQPASRVRPSATTDTRIMVVGVAALLALVVYLAVAFANTQTTSGLAPSSVNKEAPWTPWGSHLTPGRLRRGGEYDLRVTPDRDAATLGAYGALVPTIIPVPTPGTRFVVGLWLREARPGRVGVQIQKFRSGTPSRYLVDETVRVTRRWQHYTFRGQVKGSWTGVGLYVFRLANAGAKPWFGIRELNVELH